MIYFFTLYDVQTIFLKPVFNSKMYYLVFERNKFNKPVRILGLRFPSNNKNLKIQKNKEVKSEEIF